MFIIELNDNHLAIIGRALGQQPHDMVRDTIDELQKQITAQRQAAQQSATEEAKKKGNGQHAAAPAK